MKPKVLRSEIVHTNPWYRIRHDAIEWKDGVPGDYFILEGIPSSAIVAEQDGKLLVIEQYRHPVNCLSLEFPMGGIKHGESPEDAARRELREETGYDAESLEKIGSYFVANGACHFPQTVFLTKNLRHIGDQELEASESDLRSFWMPIEDWEKRVVDGTITDGCSLAVWGVYLSWKNKKDLP